MNKLLFTATLVLIFSACTSKTGRNYSDDIDKKVETLLSKMTLDEKIGQLNQYASSWEFTGPVPEYKSVLVEMERIKNGSLGSMLGITGAEATRRAQELAVNNSRLGIPLLFGYDVLHGYKTMMPVPLAIASSWDTAAASLSCRIAATEAAAAGLHWTFAPMVDICHDARWGRIMEGFGEDPFLGSLMAAAHVKGFQGKNLNDSNTIAACAKHFAAYGFAEAGRDYNTVEITEYTLRNVVLPPFKAAKDAGVRTFMNSFNVIGGTPSTCNTHLLRDILKGEWNFDGFVVSDWNSVGEIYDHGVAETKKEAARLAILAGSDMDMEGDCYLLYLKELVEEGKVSEDIIDVAVKRILKVKYELGLFDDPYKYCNSDEEAVLYSSEHLATARDIARKSIVLLKNENQLLPLMKKGQTIGVIGALAEDKDSPLGNWRAKADSGSAVSMLEGMRNTIDSKKDLFYQKGPDLVLNSPTFSKEIEFNTTDISKIDKAIKLARKVDVVVMVLGENCYQTGEGRSQADIGLKGTQQELFDAVYAVNKNIVVVLMNGRPLAIEKIASSASAIIEAWHLGSEAGNAIADVLFGDYNPSGKLPVSFPRNVGQCPIYYNHFSTGRPENNDNIVFWSHYTDQSNEPLFPFGYGLSYTTFEYSDLQFSSKEIGKNDTLKLSISLQNTGNYEGTEIVQVYIRDLFGSIARPVKELKAFKPVHLNPQEKAIVQFNIPASDLAFYTANGKWETEPGAFRLWVGTNSNEGLETGFKMVEY